MPVDRDVHCSKIALKLVFGWLLVLEKRTSSLNQRHSFMYIADMAPFYVLTGQVTYRMTYSQYPHIGVRSGIYHFVKRIQADLKQHDAVKRLCFSLRTSSIVRQCGLHRQCIKGLEIIA